MFLRSVCFKELNFVESLEAKVFTYILIDYIFALDIDISISLNVFLSCFIFTALLSWFFF